jgi:hypothetical protein
MNKEELLQELALKIKNGEINSQEILSRLNYQPAPQQAAAPVAPPKTSHFSVTKMLYIIGSAIVIIGIFFFIAQIWDDIGPFLRIFVTLILGFIIAGIGSGLLNSKPDQNIGAVFHFIGAMLIPGGVLVTLSEFDINSWWPIAFAFLGVFLFYLLLHFLHKNAVLTFFAIVNGTITTYLIFNAFFRDLGLKHSIREDLFVYLTMAIGLLYLYLSHKFKDRWNKYLAALLRFCGIGGFLGATFIKVLDSGIWELFYFIIILACLALSIYIKSRIVLIMSTIFLIIHLSYITSEHFADSIGWPISLVILGFIFIALGYASIVISKKYIQQSE